MRLFRWVWFGVLLFPGVLPAQTAGFAAGNTATASSFKEYSDPANGVSFRYPASWLLNRDGGAYIPPAILWKYSNEPEEAPDYKPDGYVALVGRDDKQGPYANTNFTVGWFLYRVASGVESAEQCYRMAGLGDSAQLDGWKVDWETIHGVRFRHGSGSGAALCNQSLQDVYATLQGNRCYLFDKQINTICEQHGENGIRDITPRELKEINHAFDAVVQSLRLETR